MIATGGLSAEATTSADWVRPRLRDPLLLLIFAGFGLELLSRVVEFAKPPWGELGEVFGFLALVVLAVAVGILILQSTKNPLVRRLLVFSALLLGLVQLLNTLNRSDYLLPAFQGSTLGRARDFSESLAGLGALTAMILAIYLVLRQTQHVHRCLDRERAELMQEVAERRRAEEKLRESEERFRLIFDGIQEGIAFYAPNMKPQFFNAPTLALLGYSVEELMEGDIRRVVHPDDWSLIEQNHRRRLEGKPTPRTYEFRLVHKDGHIVHTEASFDLIYRNGAVIGIQGIFRDVTERKRTEQALRESEQHYRELFEGITDAIFVIDHERRIVAVNERAGERLGFSSEELLRLRYEDICVGEDRELCPQRVETVLARGEARWEARRERRDGTVYPEDISARRIEYQGKPAVLLITRDITDRKRVEEALQALAEGAAAGRVGEIFHRLALNLAKALNLEYAYVVAEDGVLGTSQTLAACCPGVPVDNALCPLAGDLLDAQHDGVCLHPSGVRELFPDNAALEAMGAESCVGAPLFGSNGARLGYIVAIGLRPLFDLRNARSIVTIFAARAAAELERKRASEALRLSEERLRTLFEGIEDALCVHDLDGAILDCNAAACRHFGYTRTELLALNMRDLDAPGFHREFQERVAYQLKHGKMGFEGEHIAKDGRRIPVDVHASRITYLGRPAILAVARDITERKRAEAERLRLHEQIQHAQKLESLGVLAGGIAHDFNNLLMGVMGNASLALLDLPEDSPARESLLQIESSAQRAAELSKQMLAYSGKGRFVIQPLNLSVLVEEMAHLLEASVSKKVLLRFEFAHDLPFVEADPSQMRQVIVNLVSNASDAVGDASGCVTVATGVVEADRECFRDTYLCEELPEGLYVYLEVRDTGCGMSPEMLGKIFDPFFSTKFTGRGLGLAAVLGIVRGHKGAIKVRSQVGEGSTFTVLLPASPKRAEPAEPLRLVRGGEGSGTVLLVDDEEAVRTVTRRVLERAGFQVLLACDGVEGVEVFQAHADDITLVLLDMTMPRMSGDEAFREMRRIRADVPVVVSSGYNESEALGRFGDGGVAGFIQKPYRADELVAKLRSILDSCYTRTGGEIE